jgi:prepilin-type N-terminal cleavage/methylation domain-containing protein
MTRRVLRAFTLVELLVVISIIAILVAILLPSLTRARDSANKAACQLQLHQFAIALNMYANDNHGWLPIATAAPAGVCNDTQEYPFTIGTNTYTSNFVNLFPRYLTNKRIFLCPAFNGQNDPNYYFWYSWAELGGPLNPLQYKRSNYLYLPWRNVVYYLASYGVTSPIYGQGSIRLGQKWPHSEYKTNHTVWMSDVVADGRSLGVPEGYIWPQMFVTPHFNRHIIGGNALHGDGSVEWVAYSSGRWGNQVGNGYFDVSDE